MNITQEQAQALYEFWFNNSGSLCECCSDSIECKGMDCPKYEEFGTHINFFGHEEVLTCMDLDFATCDYLKNTRCHDCTFNIETFNWNGNVK